MIFGKKQQETRDRTMIEARAKINLTLDVTGKREDGYHLVEMVMQSVDLHDDVRVTVVRGEKKPRGIVLSCSLPFLPTDERNLAYRAAELFYKETGVPLETCEIFIEKRIPIAAGLAGGSTDAAAVLRALNELHDTGLSRDRLCEMGLKLGADVPYCLIGGTMLAEGIGEKLTQLADMPHCYVVLCKPPFAVSTREVYQEIDSVPLTQRPDTEGMKQALENGDYQGVCDKAPPDRRDPRGAARERRGRDPHERLRPDRLRPVLRPQRRRCRRDCACASLLRDFPHGNRAVSAKYV